MLIRRPTDILSSEITPESVYRDRRRLVQAGVAAGLLVAAQGYAGRPARAAEPSGLAPLAAERNPDFVMLDKLTSYEDITHYNNYYEFGTDKGDPAMYADALEIDPWSVMIEGEVEQPRSFTLEELLKLAPMEERVYRLRCVEAWSMVIPWIGYPLARLIDAARPTGNAKFVAFETVVQPKNMPGVRRRVLDWPYVEGLRMDEARHPLTLLTFGLYGKVLPKQNGAPVRIVVPWKYGFKSAKSLVRIRFTETQPPTAWGRSAPQEYGFYSNVNPEVSHPRWSQATERRIGEGGFFTPRRKTLMFNGYADQVASLYQGMDLKANY
ncbi:protein-methionine-sulfoxide reductase catalytic subunit MsrP [Verticiella sediminum]|uniref:Protein-methionine-sulfoxide reductase catalytic subunit MsrP n=1 Tax=Verticiella sediminum TaxID=1247510 RepID=A0A556A7B4_9BURK|nr:protein-methionine-sulfoxide reductase catalytic subunit MsrP [Verticiella sediminum]TSH88775.1 protein-methionine-sulfoxide reductase catalytic subunit MsrP [Verticiella sediminum]